jgi:urease accessory protein
MPRERVFTNAVVASASPLGGCAVPLLLSCVSAAAHETVGTLDGFASGFEHPLFGADHFLAMFAIGLWGAQMGGSSMWTLPITFPLIMVVGGIAGMAGLDIPFVELGIAVSVISLGTAIIFAWHPPQAITLVLVGIFAIFHGYAHGKELPSAADEVAYAVGFVVATGLIHVLGIGVGLALHKPMRGALARGLGGLIAVAGAYFVAQA